MIDMSEATISIKFDECTIRLTICNTSVFNFMEIILATNAKFYIIIAFFLKKL